MPYDPIEFDALVRCIAAGESIEASRVTHFLTLPSQEERLSVNLALAAAYHQQYEAGGDAQCLNYARACIDRALILSNYSTDTVPLLVKINQSLGDVEAIKEGLKRVGIAAEERGEFDTALSLFDRWAYADFAFTSEDTHNFDPDILASVERMAALHRFEHSRPGKTDRRKIRLAYLMHGLMEPSSVLVKIDKLLARLHDKSRFEIAYFAVNDESEVSNNVDAQAAIQNIRESGCQVILPAQKPTLYERILSVGFLIHDFEPDILITSAGLATFKNYFISCLRPAAVTISLHQGPSAQFTWHNFDHAISWFRGLIPDCPADCSFVPLEFELPKMAEGEQLATRQELGLNDASAVIVSGGRWHKFQNPVLWKAMTELLSERDDLHWLVLGVSEDKVPFLKDLAQPKTLERIRLLGWRPDYLKLLAVADLVVDTYPLGGGVFPLEAMSLGLPVISFEHDYISVFKNTAGSGGHEIVGIPELLVKRGDFEQLKRKIFELADNRKERSRLGEMCYKRARREQGDPRRMVRRCEDIYVDVLERAAAGPRGAEHNPGSSAAFASQPDLRAHELMLFAREAELNRREADLTRRQTSYRFSNRLMRRLLRLSRAPREK